MVSAGARPWIERSGFEPWPGTPCFVLGQDNSRGNLTNCGGVTCD